MTTKTRPTTVERPKTRDEAISQAIDLALRDSKIAEDVRAVGRVIDSLSIEGQPADLGRRVNVRLCDQVASGERTIDQVINLEAGTSEEGRIADAVAAGLSDTADSRRVREAFEGYFREVNSRLMAGEPTSGRAPAGEETVVSPPMPATPGWYRRETTAGKIEPSKAVPSGARITPYVGSPEEAADRARRAASRSDVGVDIKAGEPAAPKVAEATPGRAPRLEEEDLGALPGAMGIRYDESPEAREARDKMGEAAKRDTGPGLEEHERPRPKVAGKAGEDIEGKEEGPTAPVTDTEKPKEEDVRKEAVALNNEGVQLYKQEKYKEAQQRFQQSREKRESTVNTSNDAHAKYKLGQDDEQVMKDLQHALKLNKNNAHALNLMGVLAVRQGNDEEALKNYEKAVDAIESGKWKASQKDKEIIVGNRDRCKARREAAKGREVKAPREGEDTIIDEEANVTTVDDRETTEKGGKPKEPHPTDVLKPSEEDDKGKKKEEEKPKFAGSEDRFIDRVAGKMTVNEVDAMLVFIGQDPTLGEVKYSIHEKKELLKKAYQEFYKLTPKEVHPRDRIGLWKNLLHGKLDSQNITDSPIAKPAIYGEYVRRETAITEAGDFIVERLLREAEYFGEKVSRWGGSLHDACHRQPMVTRAAGASLVGAAAGALFLI